LQAVTQQDTTSPNCQGKGAISFAPVLYKVMLAELPFI